MRIQSSQRIEKRAIRTLVRVPLSAVCGAVGSTRGGRPSNP